MMILRLKDKLPFGRFKGFPIKWLLGLTKDNIPPQINYLNWFNNTVKSHIFSNKVKKLLKEITEEVDNNLRTIQNEYQRELNLYYDKYPSQRPKSYYNYNSMCNFNDMELSMSPSDYGIDY